MFIDILIILTFFCVLNRKIKTASVKAALDLTFVSYMEYFIYMILCVGCIFLAFQKEYTFLTFSGYSLMIRWGCILTAINLFSLSFNVKCLFQPNNPERKQIIEINEMQKAIQYKICESKNQMKDIKKEIKTYNKTQKKLEKEFKKDLKKLQKEVSSKEELLEKTVLIANKYDIRLED